jgi:hypothetical protein
MEKDTMVPAEGVNADQNLYMGELERQSWITLEKLQEFVQYVTGSLDFYESFRKENVDNGIIGDFDIYRFLDEQCRYYLNHVHLFILSHISHLREGFINDSFELAIDIACKAYLAIGFRAGTKNIEQKDLSESADYAAEFGKYCEKNSDFCEVVQDVIGNFNLENILESEDLKNYNYSREFMLYSLNSSSNHKGTLDPRTIGSVLLAIQMLLTIGFKAGQKYAQSQALARTGPTLGW